MVNEIDKSENKRAKGVLLRHRIGVVTAMAWVWSLAPDLPHAMDVAKRKEKVKTETTKIRNKSGGALLRLSGLRIWCCHSVVQVSAVATAWSLAWEFPYICCGCGTKKKKKKERKKEKFKNLKRGEHFSQLILWGQHYPDTKARQKHHKKGKLQTNIPYNHWLKNLLTKY